MIALLAAALCILLERACPPASGVAQYAFTTWYQQTGFWPACPADDAGQPQTCTFSVGPRYWSIPGSDTTFCFGDPEVNAAWIWTYSAAAIGPDGSISTEPCP